MSIYYCLLDFVSIQAFKLKKKEENDRSSYLLGIV